VAGGGGGKRRKYCGLSASPQGQIAGKAGFPKRKRIRRFGLACAVGRPDSTPS
jgi:hypothetical protein